MEKAHTLTPTVAAVEAHGVPDPATTGIRRRSEAQPSVAVVILNLNNWTDTVECLASLFASDYDSFDAILVDNGSTDGSVDQVIKYARGEHVPDSPYVDRTRAGLPEAFALLEGEGPPDSLDGQGDRCPKWAGRRLWIIRNPRNAGFAAGCNIGIRSASRVLGIDYFFLLNNDTAVEPSCLSRLVAAMEADSSLGVLGANLCDHRPSGVRDAPQFSGGFINWSVYPGYHSRRHRIWHEAVACHPPTVQPCDWVSGAGMMIRRTSPTALLLDEDYYFGCEDVAYCLQKARLGARIGICPEAVVYHKGGGTRKRGTRLAVYRRRIAQVLTCLRFLRSHGQLTPARAIVYAIQIAAMTVGSVVSDFSSPPLQK